MAAATMAAATSPSSPTRSQLLAQLHHERIARLRARAPTEAFSFKPAAAAAALRVELEVLPGSAIGSIVWPGAAVLCEFLASRPELVAGRRVLELGSGVGLVAVVAARLGAASVLATEAPGAEDVLRLLRANAASSGAALVGVAALAWGALPWAEFAGRAEAAGFDIVLSADCVYEPASALLLAETLALALHFPGGAGRREALMAYKERGAGALFFEALSQRHALSCESVGSSGEHAILRIAPQVRA